MIDNILFASDFSAYSERALAYGVDLVEHTGATLHFMHVQEISLGPFVGRTSSPEAGGGTLRQEFRERCREALKPYSLTLDDEHVSHVIERSGAVAPAVVEFAEVHEVDLIVMGTHGRRRGGGWCSEAWRKRCSARRRARC